MRVGVRIAGAIRGLLRVLCLPILCLSVLVGCPTSPPDDFVSISEHGFDAADNARDKNDYPWSMKYFVPDGQDSGRLYVGTGNDIVLLGAAAVIPKATAAPYQRPPEIRRYRPDLGYIAPAK